MDAHETMREAIEARTFKSDKWLFGKDKLQPRASSQRVYWDARAPDEQVGISASLRARRRDEPMSRTHWYFATREEASARWPARATGE